jgi:hypothetical protein
VRNYCIGVGTAGGPDELQGHDLDFPNYTDVLEIVGGGANSAGDVRAMPVVVHRVASIENGVNAKDVIDDSVVIVVEIVSSNFVGIAPHLGGQILVIIINAGVDDGDDHVRISGR